uniref:Uncharacterized protein n=1 Tax=Ciona savignyi TaxID=51511 RepID=H2Z8J9_CIOSA
MNVECSNEVPSYFLPSMITMGYFIASYFVISETKKTSAEWFHASIGIAIGVYILGALVFLYLRKLYRNGAFQKNFGQVEHIWSLSEQSMTKIKSSEAHDIEVLSFNEETNEK